MKSVYDRILPRPYLFTNHVKSSMPHQSCDVNTKKKHTRSNFSYHVTPLKAVQIQPDPVRTLTTCVLKINYSTTLPCKPSSPKQLLPLWFCKQNFIRLYSYHVPLDLLHHITSIIAYQMSIISSHNAILCTPSFRLT